MKTLSYSTKCKFSEMIQTQYLNTVFTFSEIKDISVRRSCELATVFRLNELCWFVLNRSLDKEIRLHGDEFPLRIHYWGSCIKNLKERYPTCDFEMQDFSDERYYVEIDNIRAYYDKKRISAHETNAKK